MSRRAKLGVALGVAAVLAGGLILASVLATRTGETTTVASGSKLPGAGDVAAELRGVPQRRLTLGRNNAPVTLVEYADMQCPFCAQWAVNVFPELVREYVRTGKLRLEWRGLSFIGTDSLAALSAVDAAALQDRLWNLAEIIFLNQGKENTGWVTDDFIRAAGRSVPGLDVDKLMNDRDGAFASATIARATAESNAVGIRTTPSFQIGRTGEELRLLRFSSLDPQMFKDAVEDQLRR